MLLRLIRFNRFGPLNRTLVIEMKSCPTNLIASRCEYISRMGLSCKAFNDSTRNYEVVYLGSKAWFRWHQYPIRVKRSRDADQCFFAGTFPFMS